MVRKNARGVWSGHNVGFRVFLDVSEMVKYDCHLLKNNGKHYCYVLELTPTETGHRNMFVGSTSDLERRLAQHLGNIEGGALRTKKYPYLDYLSQELRHGNVLRGDGTFGIHDVGQQSGVGKLSRSKVEYGRRDASTASSLLRRRQECAGRAVAHKLALLRDQAR